MGTHHQHRGTRRNRPRRSLSNKGHADGYYFDLQKGRILDEYQLLYQPEGEGVFCSAHLPETKIKAGDIFLLFPGEWHSYHPSGTKGWKSYWIGFKGKNIDDRVKAGFLSPEKPIYHVGYSNEIIALYEEAYKPHRKRLLLHNRLWRVS